MHKTHETNEQRLTRQCLEVERESHLLEIGRYNTLFSAAKNLIEWVDADPPTDKDGDHLFDALREILDRGRDL